VHRVALRHDKFIVKFEKDSVKKGDIDSALYWIPEFFERELGGLEDNQLIVFRVYEGEHGWDMIEVEDIITVIPLR